MPRWEVHIFLCVRPPPPSPISIQGPAVGDEAALLRRARPGDFDVFVIPSLSWQNRHPHICFLFINSAVLVIFQPSLTALISRYLLAVRS